VGGQVRVQTGQAIGVLAGAIQPGSEAAGKGLSIIAAQGPVEMQAQAGAAQIAAKGALELKTANGVVNIVAAKKIVLAVSGGASVTISDGDFTVQCPGKITVQAGQKSMVGASKMNPNHPAFPTSDFKMPLQISFDNAPMGIQSSWAGMPYKVFADGAQIDSGVLDADGKLTIQHSPVTRSYKVEMANGVIYNMPIIDEYSNPEQGKLAGQGFIKHEPGPAPADTGSTRAHPSSLRDSYARGLKGKV